MKRANWKKRAQAIEQVLLRALKCEGGLPGDGCLWWAAYGKGVLPRLTLCVPNRKPRRGYAWTPVWMCNHCRDRSDHKTEIDPIGVAMREGRVLPVAP